jgi:hypothetical protein
VKLTFRLDFSDTRWNGINLGRFRLAVTNRPHPARDDTLRRKAERSRGWTRLGFACLLRDDWKQAILAFAKAALDSLPP